MKNLFYTFFLGIWLLNLSQIQAFRQAGYEIKDLYETELSLFEEEVKHWTISEAISDAKITMNKQLLLGGPNILKAAISKLDYPYYERIYSGLPAHKVITVTGIFWLFDNELRDSSVTFGRVSLGGVDNSFLLSTVLKNNLFEKKTEDLLYSLASDHFKLVGLHTDSTLVLRIESYIERDSMEQSFGFRELTIHLIDLIPENFEAFGCHTSDLSHSQCVCPFRTAPNQDGVCQKCNKNCDVCYGLDMTKCLSCSSETHWNGLNCLPCHISCSACSFSEDYCDRCTAGYYDYQNGTCLDKCEWPYRIILKGRSQLCVKPCKANEYSWGANETCLSECDFPLIKTVRGDGMPICKNPCSNERDFLYLNGSCFSSCPVPLLAVFDSGVKYCKNPCGNVSHYLYSNRSCFEECPSPLQVRSEPGVNYCVNPCSLGSQYLYSNGSCHSTCPLPLRTRIEFGVKYCFEPCDSNSEYILPNGSCSSECPSPLLKKVDVSVGTYCSSPCSSKHDFISPNGSCLMDCPDYLETKTEYGVFKYCVNPCLDEEHYFYQNQSCLGDCPFPLKMKSEGGINICSNPCSSFEFLYNDQSCSEECLFPLTIRKEGGVNYCKNPCLKTDNYMSLDGDCLERCEYPYKIIERGSYKMCIIDLSDAQALQINSTKHIVVILNSISVINGLVSSFIKAGDATSILVMPLLKMFDMVKYMRISFPAHVRTMLGEQSGNFWNELLLFGILFLTMITGSCLSQDLAKKVVSILKWNVLMPMFCSLVVYFSLELHNLTVVGLMCFLLILLLIGLLFKIQRNLRRNNFEIEEGWKFLFEIYKSDQPSFVFIHTLRVTLFGLIISYMTNYPLIQALLIFLLSILMIYYLFWKSPIEKKFCLWQHLILESLLMLYNLLVLVLSILDILGEMALEFRVIIGGIMNIEAFGGPLITALLIFFKVLQYMLNSYKNLTNQADRQDFIQLNQITLEEGQDHQDSREELGLVEPNEESPSLKTVITLNPSPNNLNVNFSIANTDSGQIEVQITRSSGCLIKIEEKD